MRRPSTPDRSPEFVSTGDTIILRCMEASFWLCAVITLVSALTSLGFSIVAARISDAGAGLLNARYAMSRSGALAVVAVVAIVNQSTLWLAAVAVAMVLIQAGDAVVGRLDRNLLKTIGPAATAVANAAALLWMLS